MNARAEIPFTFSGRGSEYFRIWIVNLALTLLTLGVYSAWAKVRRLQYFHRHARLGDASFDYHGDPAAILKGRVIALGLILLYNVTAGLNPALGFAVLLLMLPVLPWLIQRSLRFRLANTSYRGLRFRFDGALGDAYRAFVSWPIATLFSLGLLAPLAHQRIKAYQHGEARYGAAAFAFSAGPGPFYAIYLRAGLFLVLPLLLVIGLGGLPGVTEVFRQIQTREQALAMIGLIVGLLVALYVVVGLMVAPWFAARVQNLVWTHTRLDAHGFASRVRARDLLAIHASNFIAIVLTLGLFKPWADVRLARYRLEHMALLPAGDLDDFVAGQAADIGAAGEETADLLDFDISF